MAYSTMIWLHILNAFCCLAQQPTYDIILLDLHQRSGEFGITVPLRAYKPVLVDVIIFTYINHCTGRVNSACFRPRGHQAYLSSMFSKLKYNHVQYRQYHRLCEMMWYEVDYTDKSPKWQWLPNTHGVLHYMPHKGHLFIQQSVYLSVFPSTHFSVPLLSVMTNSS